MAFQVASLVPKKRKAGGDAGVPFKLRRLSSKEQDQTEARFEPPYYLLKQLDEERRIQKIKQQAAKQRRHVQAKMIQRNQGQLFILARQLSNERDQHRAYTAELEIQTRTEIEITHQGLAGLQQQLQAEREERQLEQQYLVDIHQQLEVERGERKIEQQYLASLQYQLQAERGGRQLEQQYLANLHQQLEEGRRERRIEQEYRAHLSQQLQTERDERQAERQHLTEVSEQIDSEREAEYRHYAFIFQEACCQKTAITFLRDMNRKLSRPEEGALGDMDYAMNDGSPGDIVLLPDPGNLPELDHEMSDEMPNATAFVQNQEKLLELDHEMNDETSDAATFIGNERKLPELDHDMNDETPSAVTFTPIQKDIPRMINETEDIAQGTVSYSQDERTLLNRNEKIDDAIRDKSPTATVSSSKDVSLDATAPKIPGLGNFDESGQSVGVTHQLPASVVDPPIWAPTTNPFQPAAALRSGSNGRRSSARGLPGSRSTRQPLTRPPPSVGESCSTGKYERISEPAQNPDIAATTSAIDPALITMVQSSSDQPLPHSQGRDQASSEISPGAPRALDSDGGGRKRSLDEEAPPELQTSAAEGPVPEQGPSSRRILKTRPRNTKPFGRKFDYDLESESESESEEE